MKYVVVVLSQSLLFLRAFQHNQDKEFKREWEYVSRNPFSSLGHFNMTRNVRGVMKGGCVAIPSLP